VEGVGKDEVYRDHGGLADHDKSPHHKR
jgi:hypothetical protein